MTTFFESDLHLGHANIISHGGRPFSSVEEMNETIIERHNAVVRPNDKVYNLGDLIWWGTPLEEARKLVSRLNGNISICWGNHDKVTKQLQGAYNLFKKCGDILEIVVPDRGAHKGRQPIVLCHYAMRVWNCSHYGAYHLYGHSHTSLKDDPHSLSMDVGCVGHDYRPYSYEEIKEIMSKKDFTPIDRHGESQ